MTVEDCIQMLERIHDGEYKRPNWTKKADKTFEFAIKTLQREIPKYPDLHRDYYYTCPNCSTVVAYHNPLKIYDNPGVPNYCSECGQKLK